MNRVYVLINAKPGKTEEVQGMVSKIGFVKNCDVVTGRHDLVIVLEGPDLHKLLAVVAKDLHHIEGIDKTETMVAVEVKNGN